MPTATLAPGQFHRITRALADPMRYEMLRRIYASKDCLNCGGAICDLSISAATGSHHLRELEIAGLIEVRKDGRYKLLTPRRDIWKAYLRQLREV